MDGAPVTEIGSGDGAFIHVTEEGVHAEEGLAATAAVGEAEVPTSTAGEAETSGVPTGGPALSLSTEVMGEGVTLGADAEEGSAAAAAGEAEVPGSSAGEVEAGSVPTGGATLSTAIQDAGEGVTRGAVGEGMFTTPAAAAEVPAAAAEEAEA